MVMRVYSLRSLSINYGVHPNPPMYLSAFSVLLGVVSPNRSTYTGHQFFIQLGYWCRPTRRLVSGRGCNQLRLFVLVTSRCSVPHLGAVYVFVNELNQKT